MKSLALLTLCMSLGLAGCGQESRYEVAVLPQQVGDAGPIPWNYWVRLDKRTGEMLVCRSRELGDGVLYAHCEPPS